MDLFFLMDFYLGNLRNPSFFLVNALPQSEMEVIYQPIVLEDFDAFSLLCCFSGLIKELGDTFGGEILFRIGNIYVCYVCIFVLGMRQDLFCLHRNVLLFILIRQCLFSVILLGGEYSPKRI